MRISADKATFANGTAGLAVTVLFHIAIAYLLVVGSSRAILLVKNLPLEIKIVPETKKPPPESPPKAIPLKKQILPQVVVPMPEIMTAPPELSPISTAIPIPAVPSPAVKEPISQGESLVGEEDGEGVKADAWLDVKRCGLPDYPWPSQRDREQGTVSLSFLVDESGRVLESRIDKSSGFRKLDEAARTGLSVCKFKPGTINGKPRRTWKKIHFVWELPY
jgi:protein TonB